MKKNEHYGTIPGTDKPTLLKAGAEKLGFAFRLAPTFRVTERDVGNGHREYSVVCTLTHSPSGVLLGEGVGLCSTMETKYRYRQAQRICPKCGQPAIIKGKAEYGGGWVCYTKKGGCNAKFADGDASIEGQKTEQVENPDIADTYNTVLKMAKKRAHVDAILTATAASDIFTQDMEDRQPEPPPPKPPDRQAIINEIAAIVEQKELTADARAILKDQIRKAKTVADLRAIKAQLGADDLVIPDDVYMGQIETEQTGDIKQ
jgi:hypothetical protein